MRKKTIITILIISIFVFLGVVFYAFFRDKRKQPKVELLKSDDFIILSEAVSDKTYLEDEYVTFNDTCLFFSDEEIPDRISNSTISPEVGSVEYELFRLCKKYKKEFYIGKEDFYRIFDVYLKVNGIEDTIERIDVLSFGCGGEVINDLVNEPLPSNVLHSLEQDFEFVSEEFMEHRFEEFSAYKKDNTLLTYVEKISDETCINNAWIKNISSDKVTLFYGNYSFEVNVNETVSESNKVCDVNFGEGMVKNIRVKDETVSGKLLSYSELSAEIEGAGEFNLIEKAQVYDCKTEVKSKTINDLQIGYDFTDFIIDDGQICAAVICRDGEMDNIRVLLDNSGYEGRFHEEVLLTCTCDYSIEYGDYSNRVRDNILSGKYISLDATDKRLIKGSRLKVVPDNPEGKIILKSVDRNLGTPSYLGTIEIKKTEDGIIIVNEVSLEEYLKSVVPSEMPASYPMEALKTQAVCARTYAYGKMINPKLAALGANLDDSASFQVYNNNKENASTNQAIKETEGMLLYYGDNVASGNFYSTSCGYSVDASLWGNADELPYLCPKSLDVNTFNGGICKKPTAYDLVDNEVFDEMIRSKYDEDFERNESFYRWSYGDITLDEKFMYARILDLYETNNERVQIKNDEGEYLSKSPSEFTKIYLITPGERRLGGTLYSLYIETDKEDIKVIGENACSYVLTDGVTKVVLQDGSKYSAQKFLPAPWWTINVDTNDDSVVGYSIIGGGFGHGAGMSQNGAKDMAKSGINYINILEFFYEGCQVSMRH